MCLCGTNLSLVSQTAYGRRILISNRYKKKNTFVFLCASLILFTGHSSISAVLCPWTLCVVFFFPCVAHSADSAAVCSEAGDVNPEEGVKILQTGQTLERRQLQQTKYSNLWQVSLDLRAHIWIFRTLNVHVFLDHHSIQYANICLPRSLGCQRDSST